MSHAQTCRRWPVFQSVEFDRLSGLPQRLSGIERQERMAAGADSRCL